MRLSATVAEPWWSRVDFFGAFAKEGLAGNIRLWCYMRRGASLVQGDASRPNLPFDIRQWYSKFGRLPQCHSRGGKHWLDGLLIQVLMSYSKWWRKPSLLIL